MAWTEEQPFQALALTGGGYRGLFTARALQEMEDHTVPMPMIDELTTWVVETGAPRTEAP